MKLRYLFQYILYRRCHLSAFLYQFITTFALCRVDIPRNSKDVLTVMTNCEVGCNQCPALFTCLYNKCAERKPAYYPIPAGEIDRIWQSIYPKLANYRTAFTNPVRKFLILRRIYP